MESTECQIKTILNKSCLPERKVKEIKSFMIWNEKELLKTILEKGTDTDAQHSEIIRYFWDKKEKKHE